MTNVPTKSDLFWKIDNEGFYYYFSDYGPEDPEVVPADIRELWGRAWEVAMELRGIQDELMPILEEEAYEE